MEYRVKNDLTKDKELIYTENSFSGKKSLIYNGEKLNKVAKNVFEYVEDGTSYKFTLKGNTVMGVTVNMFEKDVQVVEKASPLIWVFTILILIPCFLFGAVGGAVGGLGMVTYIYLARLVPKTWQKILLGLSFMIVCALLSYLVASLLVTAIDSI